MPTKSVETEIENLKIYRENMTNDIHDLKRDVKEIKEFLMGEDPKIVTKKEFEAFKSSQLIQKFLVGIVTAVMTAIIMYEVMKITK